jgi:hypothetical protein
MLSRPGRSVQAHAWMVGNVCKPLGEQPAPWIVARSSCRYRWVDCSGVPAADRPALLAVQLQAWAPFEEPGWALVETPEGCMVWAWDAAALELAAEREGLEPPDAPRGATPLPETLLHPRAEAGTGIVPLLEGCEGQVWKGGQLLASRWWPAWPGAAAWQNFQRSTGAEALTPLPTPPGQSTPTPPPLSTPWAWPQSPEARAQARRLRNHAAAAALAALAGLPALWLAVEGWHTHDATAQLRARSEALQNALQPTLAVRNDTLAGLAAVERMTALLDRPVPLPLLAQLAGRWPGDGTVLRALEWDGTRLRLALSVPANRPRVAVIQALEDGGWLRNVREETAGEGESEWLVLVADVQPPAPTR